MDPSLSVDEQANNDFFISPCPSKERIKLNGLPFGDKEILIYNVTGQLVYKENYKLDDIEINIKSFASGLYYVKVIVENQSAIKRFIKQ